uniref:Uncharacterized protein n=1 Tax=viral metagenome TaxID=1070528 RepID=A0A6M3IQB3_9ZZZZ
MAKIFIRVNAGKPSLPYEWREVEAERIQEPWAKGFHLYLHRNNLDENLWTVTEAKSGLSASGKPRLSRKRVVEVTQMRFESVERETIFKSIHNAIIEHEISPMFAKDAKP